MSSACSFSVNSVSYRMLDLAWQGKPTIQISLKGEHGTPGGYLTSFSTLDMIEGEVFITAEKDTRFDELDISFLGYSETYVDRFSSAPTMSNRTDAAHHFLKLRQPIDESTLPQPRIAEAGRTYRFPFTFVIPAHLLPKACGKAANDQVRAAHLQLPPSMGDGTVSGFGGKLLDDITPEMAQITYAIRVTITRDKENDGKMIKIAEKSKKIRVKPAFEEQPPLAIDPFDTLPEYRLRQEKTIRKGIFKGKLGRLVMETQQPRSFHIPGAHAVDVGLISTSAKVVLRFDPLDDNCKPPSLGSLSSKLKVTTYYASTPRRNFPKKGNAFLDTTQGVYSEMVPLSSRCVAGAQWVKQNPSSPAMSRRDSGVSNCSSSASSDRVGSYSNIPARSSAYAGKAYYTAELLVPLTLPTNKAFIPTFHSCLISRVYRLDLSLGVSSLLQPLQLKVPVQISAEGSQAGVEEARERQSDEAMRRNAVEGVEDFWVPRSVAPPADATTGAPPGYEAFTGVQTRRVAVTVTG